MTKREFFNTLDRKLIGLDYDIKRGILLDYEEHFEIAQGEGKSEQDIITDLGSPEDIARVYLTKENGTITAPKDFKTEFEDFEVAKTIYTKPADNYTTTYPAAVTATVVADTNILTFPATEIENIFIELYQADIYARASADCTDIKVEIVYPDTAVESLNQYKIENELHGKTLKFYQKKRHFSLKNIFKSNRLPKIYLTLPIDTKLNELRLKSDVGSIEADSIITYKLILNGLSGAIKANSIKAVDSQIANISGAITLSKLFSETARVTCVSGSINATELDGNVLELKNVSGSINTDGISKKYSANTVSGSINATVKEIYNNIDLGTVSGSINVNVSEDVSFNVAYTSVSGAFRGNLVTAKEKSGNTIYTSPTEKGKAHIKLSSISGSLNINKL